MLCIFVHQMKSHTTFLLVILLFVLAASARSQDTLLLMNGQLLPCKILSDSGTVIEMELIKRKGKIKQREIHKSEIFSIRKGSEPEVILYAQDEIIGDDLTVEEMSFYLAGQGDARANYNGFPVFIIGLAACGTIAYLGGDGYLTAVVPPIAYIMVQFIGRVKVQKDSMSNPNYDQNDMYAYGYGPTARSRKMIRAMEGGFAGSALGVTLYLLLNK